MRKLIACTVGLTMVAFLSASVWAQDNTPPVPQVKTRAVSLPADTPHWTYEGEKGPPFWGKLDPVFLVCDKGHNQSPIDIRTTVPTSLPKLRADSGPAKLQIVHHEHIADEINNGHTIQVNLSDGDTLTIGDTSYELI